MKAHNNSDISCIHQVRTPRGLRCQLIDEQKLGDNLLDANNCLRCEIGRIQRELGCRSVGGRFILVPRGDEFGIDIIPTPILCLIKQHETTYKECKSCTLRPESDPVQVTLRTIDLLEAKGLHEASKHLRDAQTRGRNGDYAGTITLAADAVEIVLRKALRLHGTMPPSKSTLRALWKSYVRQTKAKRGVAGVTAKLIETMLTSINVLTGIRNELSDAHGGQFRRPLADESFAEMALGLACTLSMFVAKRLP
jgi:hypothetical protein